MTMYGTRMKTNGLLPLFILYFTLICTVSGQDQPDIILLEASGELGKSANVTCSAEPVSTDLSWLFNGQPLNSSDVLKIYNETRSVEIKTEWKESIVFIKKTTRAHAGNYTCVATYGGQNRTKTKALDLSFPVKATTKKTVYYVNETKNDHGNNLTMTCSFEMYQDPEYVEWIHPSHMDPIKRKFVRSKENDREILSTFELEKAGYNTDNGIFQCRVYVPNVSSYVTSNISLVVYGDPTIKATAIGINTTAIYVNWTINTANSEVTKIVLLYQMENGEPKYLSNQIPVNSTSVVISDLKQATNYTVFVKAETKHGKVEHPPIVTKTLEFDPVFVPIISINGFSATSVTIGITAPPKEIEQYVHYYLLEAQNKNGGAARKAYHSRDSRNLPYMFDNLQPYSTYIFKVKACQDYTKQCWDWSKEMEAATLDGVPGIPSNVKKNCSQTHMFITWSPPDKPNAEIKGYMLEFTGTTEYRDRTGNIKKETIGPLSRFKSNDSMSARFDLQPNTQYVVRVSAMTRTRRRGDEYEVACSTAPAPPDVPPRPRWRKILDKDRYVLKMHLPKVSERNGPICCYRVYMVRLLGQKDLRDLPNKPSALEIINYNEAHSAQPVQGAYIADIFTNVNFPVDSEVVLGDEHNIFNRSDPTYTLMGCEKCLKRPVPDVPQPKVVIVTTTVAPTTTTEDDGLTDEDTEAGREKRSEREYVQLETLDVNDGALDSTANYTAFVELIPMSMTEEGSASLYSYYLNQLMPAPTVVATAPASTLEIALQATCGVAALILILMIGFCVMQSRRSRKMQPRGRYEMNSFPRFFSGLWGGGGGRGCRLGGGVGGAGVTEAPPIAREDLPAAYAQRHADCDLAFQMEFELLQKLSEYITDRTTVASEARENQQKNRYPDIKAYDQTRVKLAQIDGITGSDYINANYVMGYKERKKFICAQGPTDTTVNDFWRMIWEHGLELIVMLTNLEEYSKVKCSKYWPDDVKGTRAFGHITVTHVGEKRYSDYIVRELKITKQPTNSEGQPIVENNGVAKRNGDIRDGSISASESGPASPRSACGEGEGESRTVRQYHFLMWKDFAAPEHPHSILKFIKRVNEAWASMLGRPVVVHCSAGVGRTGTLVALDCLLQQLNATGYVSVFNTVAELRRQRNFLVQSQKQYVFVYRALVEYAHYGDTEIAASKLRSTIDQLRNTPEGADKCMLELQFEKIQNVPVTEAAKSWSAGGADELRGRNRSADCLPYDKNRVILTPIPQRDYSTYINASFVEAYDNSKGFIITQDPLPTTIFDFWRMVSEQSVSTIVMLSELGDSKCPRYWDDGTAQYEHISVQYEESEALPYYTRRQFRVTNTRSGHVQVVRQLQYQGWPTAPGHVPEVTRGLAELADAALPAPSANANANEPSEDSPMLVHCNLGTERSALFCALCVLVCALRTERRVDVSAVARKIRAQRAHTINTYLQYEFLHRAILNYAELHNLLEDS